MRAVHLALLEDVINQALSVVNPPLQRISLRVSECTQGRTDEAVLAGWRHLQVAAVLKITGIAIAILDQHDSRVGARVAVSIQQRAAPDHAPGGIIGCLIDLDGDILRPAGYQRQQAAEQRLAVRIQRGSGGVGQGAQCLDDSAVCQVLVYRGAGWRVNRRVIACAQRGMQARQFARRCSG